VLEAVPNVSEGRDQAVIDAVGGAFASSAQLLDVHADADHHRSVFTLAGAPDALVDALVAGTARAVDLIDLRQHAGVHPRVGIVDVVPLVPFVDGDLEPALAAALATARRIGEEVGVSVFLYGDSAEGRRPVFFRRGGLAELERRIASGELAPDFGPPRPDPRSGATLVGARKPLVAYNVVLATADVDRARRIAERVRESGGGLPGVQAIGLGLPRAGKVQVSMNIVDLDRSALHDVFLRVRDEARELGVEVEDGELVGLVPERSFQAALDAGVEVPGVDETRVLERALRL
jgi:glutamate formiminotransferase